MFGWRSADFKISGSKIPTGADRKRLVTFVEIDRCATDAIGVVTGCRLGKRALKFRDFGKMAATFCDLRDDRAVRVVALESSKDRASELYPHIEKKNEQQMLAYREMPDDELFATQWVRVEIGPEEMPGYKAPRDVRRLRRRHQLPAGSASVEAGLSASPAPANAITKFCSHAAVLHHRPSHVPGHFGFDSSGRRGGVDFIQIREKDLNSRDLFDLALAAVNTISAWPTRVLVNGRVDIALAAGTHGVHLPARSILPSRIPAHRAFGLSDRCVLPLHDGTRGSGRGGSRRVWSGFRYAWKGAACRPGLAA